MGLIFVFLKRKLEDLKNLQIDQMMRSFLVIFNHCASDDAKWSQFHVLHDIVHLNELNNVRFKAFLAFLCPILNVPYAYFKAVKMSCTQRLLSKRLFFYMSNAQQFKVKKVKYRRHHRLILSCLPCLSSYQRFI